MEDTLCFAAGLPARVRGLFGGRAVAAMPVPRGHVTGSRAAAARRVRAPRASAAVPQSVGTDEQDVLLGELAFTEPDLLPNLVRERLASGALNDSFYAYVQNKIDASADLEERETLRLLLDAVKQLADDAAASVPLKESAGSGEEPAFATAEPEDVAEATYEALVSRFIAAAKEKDAKRALEAIVEVEYEAIDKRFLDSLEKQKAAGGPEAEVLAKVSDAISEAMSRRVAAAAEKLREVLSAGPPPAMRSALEILAAKGGVDDAFILLLQGNIQQARDAGADGPEKILASLMEHARTLSDARLDPEVRLIRKLLRTEDRETRIEVLTEAFTPGKSVLLADGSKTLGVRVNGKKFVVALRELIAQYSNIEEAFAMRLSEIGEESEAVARKLFDMEEKTVQDLQDEAFHKRSVSVWDLEQVEMQEEVQGRKAGWEGRMGAIPEGFDEHGKMTI